MDKLTRGIDKESCIVLLALLQHDNAGSNADAKEKIGRQLNDGVDVVIVDQVFADFLFGSATVEHTGELDDSRRTVGRQPRKHVHRKGKVGFALRGQNTRRRESRVVNQQRIFIPDPFDRVRRIGDDALERFIVPMFRGKQRIAQCNIELFVVDIVQEHVDAAKIVGGNIDLLPIESLTHILLAEHFGEFQQ